MLLCGMEQMLLYKDRVRVYCTLIQVTDLKTGRQTDICSSEKRQAAMWLSCPHLDLVSRAAGQNDHTWCPSFSVSVRLLSLSTLFWEFPSPPPPLHTHTHRLSVCTYTQRRMGKTRHKKSSHSLAPLALQLPLNSPKVSLFSVVLSAYSSHKGLTH